MDEMHAYERALMARKASDYSGEQDCNRNIKACSVLGICSTKQGLQVRLLDKFQRLITLTSKPAKVADESLKDTIHDARVYLAIYAHILEEESGQASKQPVPRPTKRRKK